ncbi:MAG: GNAT family N-acetyltransferase [Roseiflexaceae bacterium]
MSILIRAATPDDAAAILELNRAYDDLRATADHVADHIRHRAAFEQPFVAEIDRQVVGLACLRLIPCLCDPIPSAELTELIVLPAYRRRGVGTALIRAIEQQAQAQGANQLILMTAWRNTHAHAFYHRCGYRLYTIMMKRDLSEASAQNSTPLD